MTSFVLEVCLSILLIILIKYIWERRRLYHYAIQVKGPPPLPIIGSAYTLLGGTQNILEAFMNLTEKYEGVYKLWLGNQLCFVVSNPEDVQVILNGALEKLPDYKFLIPAFGKGLITLPALIWKKHRKLIRVSFSSHILNNYVETFSNYSDILVEKLGETVGTGYFDLFPILTQCTVDILSDTTMGVKLNIMKEGGNNLIPWTSRLSELGCLRIANPFVHNDFFWNWTSMAKETQDLAVKVYNYIKTIIKTKRREKMHNIEDETFENDPKKTIFLDHMFELENSERMWTQENTVEEAQTILVAGCDATALTSGYVLMMLGMHQEIQEKAYEELKSVFGNEDREITADDLNNLTYLERVIKETLRLFPVGPILGRHLTEDVVLDDHTLPKGSSIFIPVISIHRDPDVWPEPLKFNPDRFLPDEVAKRHPYSYLPFSSGPRKCIGFRYAMMAMQTILAKILRNYKVVSTEYKNIDEIELKVDVAIKCVRGQKVELERRL